MLSVQERIQQQKTGNSLCPVHKEKTPSLHVSFLNGRTLMYCFGCLAPIEKIVEALGLEMSDLFAGGRASYPIHPVQRTMQTIMEEWRHRKVRELGAALRWRDTVKVDIMENVLRGELTEEEAFLALDKIYEGYAGMEYQWSRLLDEAHWTTSRLYGELCDAI